MRQRRAPRSLRKVLVFGSLLATASCGRSKPAATGAGGSTATDAATLDMRLDGAGDDNAVLPAGGESGRGGASGAGGAAGADHVDGEAGRGGGAGATAGAGGQAPSDGGVACPAAACSFSFSNDCAVAVCTPPARRCYSGEPQTCSLGDGGSCSRWTFDRFCRDGEGCDDGPAVCQAIASDGGVPPDPNAPFACGATECAPNEYCIEQTSGEGGHPSYFFCVDPATCAGDPCFCFCVYCQPPSFFTHDLCCSTVGPRIRCTAY